MGEGHEDAEDQGVDRPAAGADDVGCGDGLAVAGRRGMHRARPEARQDVEDRLPHAAVLPPWHGGVHGLFGRRARTGSLDGARRRAALRLPAPPLCSHAGSGRIPGGRHAPPSPRRSAAGRSLRGRARAGREALERRGSRPRRPDGRDRRAAGAGARRRNRGRSARRRADRPAERQRWAGAGAAAGAGDRPGRGADREGHRGLRPLCARHLSPGARPRPGRRAGRDLLCALQQAGHAPWRPRLRGRAQVLRRCPWPQRLCRRDQCDRRARDDARHLACAAARRGRPDHRGRRGRTRSGWPTTRCGRAAIRIRGSASPG